VADDVGSGAAKYLSQFSDVTSLLGSFSATDTVTGNQGRPWLFNTDLLVKIKGTSSAALVLSDFGGWSAPQLLSGARNRRLRVDLYQDAQRDSAGNIQQTNAATVNAINHLFTRVHLHLQRRDNDTVVWGDLITYACQVLTEPVATQLSDGDWAMFGTAIYGVSFSGWTDTLS
jgi:hypothetical protein